MAWHDQSRFESLIDDLLLWLRAGLGLVGIIWVLFAIWLSGRAAWYLVDAISQWLA